MSLSQETFRQVVLRVRPTGMPVASDFAIDTVPIPVPEEGEFVVRNLYVSLDPAIRQRLSQVDSYAKLIEIGGPLTSTTLGEVVASENPEASVGDHVVGFHTVAEYSLATWTPLTRHVDLAAAASPSNHLSVLGPTGLTAYFGLLDIGKPQPGETVLVSTAAGAVGSVAAQIARIKGCRVVGIAGGSEKCELLTEVFGLDAAINYQGLDLASLTAAIRQAAPDGVDVYFDNVGGIQLDAALDCLNLRGRVALCGLISHYNAAGDIPPFTNFFRLIAKTARIEGFTVLTYAEQFPQALAELAGWVADGRIVFREHIEKGIESGISAFLMLFDGSNRGKMMLDLQGD